MERFEQMFATRCGDRNPPRGPASIVRGGTDSALFVTTWGWFRQASRVDQGARGVVRRCFTGRMTDVALMSPTLLAEADQRLVRTFDGLSDEELAAPSLLPGWTRAHVIAHLTLNAEALERVLTGRRRGEQRTMYDSQESRDADVEALARAGQPELRDRFFAATTCFEKAYGAMTEEDASAHFERTPGGQVIKVGNAPLMRLREVEIHHADLGAGYTAADWPPAFCAVLIESMTKFQDGPPFRVLARDLARTWQLGDGEGGPVVAGDAGAIGWWLTGRGNGEGLDSDSGALPEMGAW